MPFGTEQQNPLGANLQSASASHRPFASAVRLDNPSVSHSWSSAGDSWNDSLHPPSFGSSASQLSSSVDSDIGGAPITPRDARHHKAHGKPFSTGSIYAETDTEDEEDGGIGFDMEMDPVGVLYQSSTMVMDEDEGFSPLNLVTRPPSPIGGGLVGILPLLSQDDGVDTPGSSMQIDSPVRTSPLNDLLLTPTRSGHRSPLSIQPHLLSSQSPHGHTAASAENPVEEEAPEIYMPDSDPLGEQEDGSMASQDSLSEHTPSVVPSPEPPTPISEETGNGLAEMPTISHYHADHDHMLAAIFDPVPSNFFLENLPHSISYPGFFMGPPPITYLPDLLLRPPTIPTAGFSTTADFDSVSVAATYGADPSDEEDEIAQSTNDVVFDDVLSQEMERYNSDFAGFCGQLWNEHALSKMRERGLATTQRPACNNPPPHISAEGAKIMEWAKTRRNEITVEDVEEGEDMQGIQWGKLELSKKAARKWRQARYQNYRNLQVFEKEILVCFEDILI